MGGDQDRTETPGGRRGEAGGQRRRRIKKIQNLHKIPGARMQMVAPKAERHNLSCSSKKACRKIHKKPATRTGNPLFPREKTAKSWKAEGGAALSR